MVGAKPLSEPMIAEYGYAYMIQIGLDELPVWQFWQR